MPRFLEIYTLLRSRIASGVLLPGSRLPAEPALAAELKVARKTLRNALTLLQKEGLIRRTPHKGTFVCDFSGRTEKRILFVNADQINEGPWPSTRTTYYTYPGVLQRCRELKIECDHVNIRMVKNILPLGESYKGIILESPRVGSFPEELALLREQKLPMLNIAGFEKTPSACQCPCVFPDRKKALLAGVEHLLRRGHRRIAFLLTLNWQKVQERLRIDEKEFVEQLEKLGLKKEQISIGFCNNDNPDDMIEQTIKLFSGKEPRPTAIFCDTDGIAAFAYEGLRRLELAIPDDVAVLGFVGCLANCLLKPGLSTVDFDYKRAAAFAVDLLLSPDYAGLPPVIYSPFDVVVRESTSVIRHEIERK